MLIAVLVASSLLAASPGIHSGEPRYEAPARIRVSQGVMRTLMANQVVPDYPKEAKSKGIQGTVLLSLAVDEKGRTSDVKVVSGHPLLVPVTVEAVKRLRFRPYQLNGEAVPIQGYVSYMFTLANGKATVTLGPGRSQR